MLNDHYDIIVNGFFNIYYRFIKLLTNAIKLIFTIFLFTSLVQLLRGIKYEINSVLHKTEINNMKNINLNWKVSLTTTCRVSSI